MTDRLRVGLVLFVTLALAAAPAVSLAEGPPANEDPDAAGELYGDLYVLERDGNGEPITEEFSYEDPEDPETLIWVTCTRPIASDCTFIPLNVEKGDEFDPEEEDACGPQADYLELLQGVEFGRGSVVRSPESVVVSAYAEFLATANAATAVDRDPAGRIKLLIPSEIVGEAPVWKTIDAPLANLGLYREVMLNGCLGTVTEEVVGDEGNMIEVTYALGPATIDLLCGGTYPSCDGTPLAGLLCAYPDYPEGEWWMTTTPDTEGVTRSDMLLATAFIAGATDKGNPLSLDEIVNINTYLGINTYTWVKEQKTRILTVTYFPFEYGDEWFAYNRGVDAFDVGTTDRLLGGWDGEPEDTTFEIIDPFYVFNTDDGVDLDSVAVTVCRNGAPRLDSDEELVCDDESDEPYDGDQQLGCGGANWFTQAAEYARKTVWFVHNWAVPELAR